MTRFSLDTVRQDAIAAVKAEGLRPFARRTGLALGIVRGLEENRDLSVSNMLELASAMDFEINVTPKRFSGGFSEIGATSDLGQKEALRSGFLPIPWHNESGMKGSSPFAFSSAWLATAGLTPDNLSAVAPRSSRLSFSLAKNTVAVIQANAPKKGHGGIWAFKDGASVGIAQATFADDLVILLPPTEAEDAIVLPKNSLSGHVLLGKVVWSGHVWE